MTDSAITSDGRHAAKMSRALAFNLQHGTASPFEIATDEPDADVIPTAANYGQLPAGTVLPNGLGTVERASMTAYLVGPTEGLTFAHWVPFATVHPQNFVRPLVSFG